MSANSPLVGAGAFSGKFWMPIQRIGATNRFDSGSPCRPSARTRPAMPALECGAGLRPCPRLARCCPPSPCRRPPDAARRPLDDDERTTVPPKSALAWGTIHQRGRTASWDHTDARSSPLPGERGSWLHQPKPGVNVPIIRAVPAPASATMLSPMTRAAAGLHRKARIQACSSAVDGPRPSSDR